MTDTSRYSKYPATSPSTAPSTVLKVPPPVRSRQLTRYMAPTAINAVKHPGSATRSLAVYNGETARMSVAVSALA